MRKINGGIILLIMLFWFVISFITNIMGPLIPDVLQAFRLSHLVLAGLLPTSFFLAYAIMSIPAGIMIEKFSEKRVLIIGFLLPFAGSLIFALWPSFSVLLISSFIIGLGMAMLQTVINPLTRVAGKEENFAFFSVMGQLVFGIASFISPLVYARLISEIGDQNNSDSIIRTLSAITPDTIPWVSLYWVFACITMVIILITVFTRFPVFALGEDEKSGPVDSYKILFRKRVVYLYFAGIVCYVATEQGIANWMSQFLLQYHGMNPQTDGAHIVSLFWGLMSVGCLVGLALLKLFDSKQVLKVAGFLSLILLFCGIFGNKTMASTCLPAMGFTISVMFSIIMSLGLNSVSRHHGSFAGILCTGIVGGALGPLIIGYLADYVGLRFAMTFISLTLGYIIVVGFVSRPLISNKTVALRNLFKHDDL